MNKKHAVHYQICNLIDKTAVCSQFLPQMLLIIAIQSNFTQNLAYTFH